MKGRKTVQWCFQNRSIEVATLPEGIGRYPIWPEIIEENRLAYAPSASATSKFSAWPQALVWDNQQKLRGFLMPMVQGKEIHELFQPKERFTKFPNTKWDFLVRVARNVAAAFDEVHRIGVVIGDVNEGNLLVKRDSTICLIDCDSYQTGNNGQTWTCDVGVAFWTPPELQGRNFRGLVRQANHDLFGLSAMIFKLLFMGRHPYAGKSTRPGETLLEQAIAEFRFAFSDQAATYGMEPPPHCLPLGVLARNHRDLFERAFTRGSERDGARPSWTPQRGSSSATSSRRASQRAPR